MVDVWLNREDRLKLIEFLQSPNGSSEAFVSRYKFTFIKAEAVEGGGIRLIIDMKGKRNA